MSRPYMTENRQIVMCCRLNNHMQNIIVRYNGELTAKDEDTDKLLLAWS